MRRLSSALLIAWFVAALAGSLGCNGSTALTEAPRVQLGDHAGRTLHATKDTRSTQSAPAPNRAVPTAPGQTPAPPGRGPGHTLHAVKSLGRAAGLAAPPVQASPPLNAAHAAVPPGRGPGHVLRAVKRTDGAPPAQSPPRDPNNGPATPPGHEYGQDLSTLLAQARDALDRGEAAQALNLYTRASQAANAATPDLALAHAGRGHSLAALSRHTEAVQAYTQALALAPNLTEALAGRGRSRAAQGAYPEALADLERAVVLEPSDHAAHHSLAWLLATCTDSTCRDGERAVQAAQRAVDLAGDGNMNYLDTLAAAYAEAKRFDDAVATQERVVEELRRTGSPWLAQAQARLEMYRGFKPFRDQN